MKKKHLLRSILAIALCILMIGTVIAVGYTIYENVQGKKVVIDKDNNLPVVKPSNGSVSAPVTTENGLTVSDVTLKTNNDGVLAVIPQGTKLNDGVKEVTLTVKEIKDSQANIELEANEEKVSYDIHIEGVANDNTAPIKVYVKEMLPSGLNMGNYSLYHVENGTTTAMTVVNGEATHNSFEYDAVTGDVTLYLASFSEVALVADTTKAWEGNVEAFTGSGTEEDPFIIANADQFAYFSQLISKENGTYGDKHYKLVADVNLNGSEAQAEDNKGLMFYPVGYWAQGDGINAAGENIWYTYGGAFKGVFDGNGHKISNVYQNTWLMDGDYDNGYWDAAMGIFGYVYGGTIKNLTVDNFSSDGEFTPTGVIAAYAVNSTFENIAITNCNPRVYNTGNGGIVGIGGNSDDPDTYGLTFTNITIDNSNKISALWGSWDVACGGLVGMFRGAGHVNMTNCHVAAQIDVFNDVCGNYQYYWYRYSGMMIGTNKNMITDKDGYTVPETSKFHAENCTVHFGEWNNYYYCELVANTLASYTHDHQFSRLEQVDVVDTNNMTITVGEETTTIPTSGRYNYVVVNGKSSTENATCYHFVDGKVWNHADAGTETVNGQTVLKEDNQHIYLPFNQLFTGYGWGVKHIPVYNGEDYAFEGIEILDRKVADSVEKFDKLFTGDFLYRVGNLNTVSIGSLFAAKDGAKIINDGVWVTIDKVDENSNVSGTFTTNKTDWKKGSIQFSGTGVVKVTIQDYNFCTPTVLTLEVVDAVNATGATSATANNVVLLNDCGFSSLEVSGGYTLYGNGFTMTCGSDSVALDMGYSFVTLDNGTLDNIQIVCPNFDLAVLYKSNMTDGNRSETDSSGKTRYYNVKSGVMVSGNSQILNSRISGARAAVNVAGGNLVIDNSQIELGAVANILVGAANNLTLRDVTLVQKPTASTYDPSKILMGFSVLFMCNSEGNATPLTIEGTFVQNAWVDESDSSYVPSAGQSLISSILKKTDFLHDIDGDGTRESLNLGFAYMPESTSSKLEDLTITNTSNIPYDFINVNNACVYSYKYSTNEVIPASYINTPNYVSSKYGDIIIVNYSDTADGLESGKSFGANGWVYELNVDLDKLNGYAIDFNKLTMVINSTVVTDYTVNGNAKPASPVAVVAGGTTYVLTATIDGKEYTANFKVIGTETTKESPSLVSSSYASALLVGEAGSTLNKDTWHGAAPVLEGIQIKYWSVAEKQYKTIKLSDYTPTTAGKQNGTNKTWTYTPANKDFTLTITGGQVHSGNKVDAMPVVCGGKLYFVAASSNGLVNYGNSARTIPVTYSFKDNNSGTELTFSHTWSIECADKATAYDYSDFCNGTSKTFTIKSSNGNTCVTGDTLVYLADGTQKRIDEVTYEDILLVWNFFDGEYAYVPASVIFYHGDDNYDILTLNFEDGTSVKVINNHGFFDVEANEFVFIDIYNIENYIGHSFVKVNGSSFTSVKLMDYTVTKEFTGSYSIQTAQYINFVVENMLSLTFPPFEGWFDYFEIGDGMKYDEAKMQEDIEKYGLYTYDDFKDYVTYEQFIAFNGPYLKVLVGRGVLTFEDILNLIATYVQ